MLKACLIQCIVKITSLQVFVLAQSEMELPFPLEQGKTDTDGSDDEGNGMSYPTSRG